MRKILPMSGAFLSLALMLGMGQGAALAAPGNNGTIQVVTGTNPDGSLDCEFNVEFYNFDAAQVTSQVEFSLQAPTEGTSTDPIETDAVSFTGGQGLDATASFDLSNALDDSGAVAKSGAYHVKVRTDSPYSNGAGAKYKVFWVSSCGGGGSS
jgi:hypothetical protein